jgi:hypothetical protein
VTKNTLVEKAKDLLVVATGTAVIIAIILSIILFWLTFLFGAVSIYDEEPMCDAVDVNVERIWPVRAACWFWKRP